MVFGKKKNQDEQERQEAAAMSRKLRDQALSVTAGELNLAPAESRPHVWGALMELGYPETVATLAAFADGSTSLYISTGGGVIGAGEHTPVREEADRFLSVVQEHIAEFLPITDTPHPQPGRVRFYVRTYEATLTAEADQSLLGNRLHKLSPVFHAGHAVITQMRLISERHDDA